MKWMLAITAAAFAATAVMAGAHQCPAGAAAAVVPAKLVTSDIDLFWRAYDLADAATMPDVLEREYLKKGSAGLAEFTRLRIGDSRLLADTVRRHPRYYAGLRAQSQRIDAYKPAMQAAFDCLRAIYPEAVMPDVYFVIGRMNSAGTVDTSRLLIGVDMFGRGGAESTAELGAWHRAVVSSIDRLPFIVAHELIHAQQAAGGGGTLLAAALNEGVADFVGELIAGQNINPQLHEFARHRHPALWREFERVMRGRDLGGWLYQGERATAERPADLGYVIGYRIAAAYYDRQPDKSRAIREMLNIRDPEAFLEASGYAGLMNARGQ